MNLVLIFINFMGKFSLHVGFNCLQRALFDEGCIYVGVPPLFKVSFKIFSR